MAPLNKNRSIANRAAALALWEAKFPLKKIREATGYSERQIRRIRVRATERGYNPKSSTGFKDEFFKDELRPGRRGKSKFISTTTTTTTTENSTTEAAITTVTTTATEAANAPVTTEGIAVADLLQAQKGGEQETGERKGKDEHDDDTDSEMDEYGEGE